MMKLMLATAMFEEDVDGTFFSSAPGYVLMHCVVCERQQVLSISPGPGPEVYCSGGRLLGRHERTKMVRLGSRDKEDSS